MPGICSYGAYIPMPRLKAGRGERALCSHDEDSVTMAVAAAADCLRGIDRSTVDAVLFASTTHAYSEKLAAGLVARALDVRRDVRTADYSASLRAGLTALCGAFDAVAAGSAKRVLVVATDCRVAAPGTPTESKLGAGAAAFLIADTDLIAKLDGSHAIADEILDVWRADGDPFVRTWEDRFVVKHGYRDNLIEATNGLFGATSSTAADFDRAVVYGPDARSHSRVVKALGLDPDRVQDPLLGAVGDAGAASVPLMLAAALATASAGERLLVAAYGDGAEAIALRTTDRIAALPDRRGVAWHLERRRTVDNRPPPPERGGAGGVSATKHWRDRDQEISFKALACRKCETMHFPATRVCYRCQSKDDFEPVRLSDKTGRVLSYTFDHFHPSAERPTIAGMVEVDGGCRVYLMMTDASPDQLRCDLPVEFTFRKIHDAGGKPNYFWKSTPCPTPSETK